MTLTIADDPECPDCETNLHTARCGGNGPPIRCHLCGRLFDPEEDKADA